MSAQPTEHRRSLARRLVRIFLKTLLTIVIIILLVFFLIQTPFVQNFARAKIESYLSRKLKTPVRIGHLDITFFRSVTLKDIYLPDRNSDTLLSAGMVSVRLRMLALLHNNLDIREIDLKNLTAKILRRSPSDTTFNYQFIIDAFTGRSSTPANSTKSAPMLISMNTLLLDDIRFIYADTLTGNTAQATIGHSRTDMRTLDLDKQIYDVANSVLKNTALLYRNSKTAMTTRVRLHSFGAKGLILRLDTLGIRARQMQLDSADFAYDDNTKRRLKKGMDYFHLLATNTSIHAEDLAYSANSISGRITKGELSESSGFRLDQLQTSFYYSNDKTLLEDLLLKTPGTLLQRSVRLRYDSVAAITTHPAKTLIVLDLPNSHVQLKDILVFAPYLASQPVFSRPNDVWRINAAVRGTLDDLTIQALQFDGIKDIKLDLAGKLVHPMDNRRIHADLAIRNFSGSRAALVGLLPRNTLPSNIEIPARFALHGHLAGGMDDINSDLTLRTSSGSVLLKGTAHNIRSTTGASYDLGIGTRGLDLGYILRDTLQWGAVTADFHLRGTGLDKQSANSAFSGSIRAATFRQYTWRDLALDGSLKDQRAILRSTINNTAVHFELQATAQLQNKFPALRLDWNIDTLDLHALHFAGDTLQVKGHLIAGFESTNPDSLEGNLRIAGLDVLRGTQHLATDSIIFQAHRVQDIQDIQLHTEMADLDWKGRYKLTEAATALEHTIDRYYHVSGFKDTAFTSQDWTLDFHLRPSPLLLSVMPSLKSTDTVGGRIGFNSDEQDLRVGLRAPRIVIGEQFFHDITFHAATADSNLHYDLTFADGHGSGLLFYKTSLFGDLHHDQLSTTVLLRDENGKNRYRIAGALQQQESATLFRLNPDSLLLNYERWLVSRDNFLRYDSTGILVHNLAISNDNDTLALNTHGTTGHAPLDARFANFRLSTISRLANQDSVIADGTLQGNVQVMDLTTKPVFTSDLLVRTLTYKSDTLGDLALKVNNKKANAFSADISLRGNKNDVTVKGDYFTGESKMDLKIDLNQINLSNFTHLAASAVDSMRGFLTGKFAVTGTLDKPNIRGNLYFDSSTVITPTVSGEPFKVSRDRVAFDEDGFNFSEFTLQDSAGNKLILDGNVFTKDYHDFSFDISLNAQNFRLVNAPENSSRQFYGQMNIDAAINLEGNMGSPKIDGDLRVNRHTNFFFVLLDSDPEVVDRLGIVRFVSHTTGDTLVDRKALAIHQKKSQLKGFDLAMNIQTDSSAQFNIVVDPKSGDALNVRGLSHLVYSINKSGKMDLTGSFEVESGFYTVSFNVIKRKFVIDRGSTITWAGDPYSAQIDLTASYTANTPSIDLVANELSDRTTTELTKFRQKLPFLVTLKMGGELMKPSIAFDISLPANVLSLYPDVDVRLQQLRNSESELDKQVFALLLINRFVGDDPLQSKAGGGSSVGSIAFQSASQILTNQMDQLAASLIKGVDIHFDLNNQQDFTQGYEIDYTELTVGLSKALMKERMRVSVGSNFDVAGTAAPGQAPSNFAGNVAVDYKLSRDGRYLLRAYRQNQYEAVIQGQVVETGVSFILSFDYDKLKEIFRRSEEDRLEKRKTSKPSKNSDK